MEKALSGVGSQGDNGVSTRLFGSFLIWLSDHTSEASVLNAGGAITAQVATTLTEGIVKAMFLSKLRLALGVLLVLVGLGLGATSLSGLFANQPQAQLDSIDEQAGSPEKPATDQERILGNWVVVNDEGYLGKKWTFRKDVILMDMNFGLPVGMERLYHPYHLDPEQNPKHLTFAFKIEGDKLARTLLELKCIYALDGDELEICLCPDDPDEQRARQRPRAFPKKPGPGQVLAMKRILTPEEVVRKKLEGEVWVEFRVQRPKGRDSRPDRTGGVLRTESLSGRCLQASPSPGSHSVANCQPDGGAGRAGQRSSAERLAAVRPP